LGRQRVDAKIPFEMDINILLDAPPHAYWESAVLLVLDGHDFGVERIQAWSS
jgi:hypothetical protein